MDKKNHGPLTQRDIVNRHTIAVGLVMCHTIEHFCACSCPHFVSSIHHLQNSYQFFFINSAITIAVDGREIPTQAIASLTQRDSTIPVDVERLHDG